MDSDAEFEDEQEKPWKGVSGTVVLINAYDPVNTNVPQRAYQATCDLVRHHLRTASSQLLGICVYGIENDNDDFKQVIPLSTASLEDFKTLQNTDIVSFRQTKEFKMSSVLWHANKMFTNCKKLLSTKSVILLTRMDIPPIEMDQKPSWKRVVDLVDSGIWIKIVNISEGHYHCDNFYNIFLTEAHKGNDFEVPVPVWENIDIMKSLQKFSHRHLAVAYLDLQIDENFSISVGVYNMLQSHTKPKKVRVDSETNQIVQSVTTTYKVQSNDNDQESYMDVDGPSTKQVPLLKSELLYTKVFGDETIAFTDDEMKKLRNPFGPPMLKLLGFKPASVLNKEKWFLKPCTFLYPNEKQIQGSTVAFRALHQACTEMSVIAFCVLCTRVNARPKLVALQPCQNPLGLDVNLGFDVIPVPFDENIKNVPMNENSEQTVSAAQKEVLKGFIKELEFTYKHDTFQNPNLQTLHRAIEALALEQDYNESHVDTTKPDPNKYNNIDGKLFHGIFGQFGATATKRPAAASNNRNASKKEKFEEDIDDELLASRLKCKQIEKYNVADLKKILKAKNIPNLPAMTALKKNDLVQLVYENL